MGVAAILVTLDFRKELYFKLKGHQLVDENMIDRCSALTKQVLFFTHQQSKIEFYTLPSYFWLSVYICIVLFILKDIL